MTDFSKYLVRLEVSRVSGAGGSHGCTLVYRFKNPFMMGPLCGIYLYGNIIQQMGSKLIEITFGISRSLFYNKPKSYLKS